MEGQPHLRRRVVAMLNQKGGVGKTTSTVNVGAALADAGLRVLLVDLDPQANLSLHFGFEPGDDALTVHDLLLDPESRAADAIVRPSERVAVLPSVTELALAEGALASLPDMQRTLARALEPVLDGFDVVLLDCPPSLGVLTVNALTLADEVFVPMQAHYLALRGLEKLLSTVHLVSQGLNPRVRVTGIVLCMHESQSSHGKAVLEEIQTQLEQYRGSGLPWSDCRVLLPPIRRNIKLAEAPSFGKTIFEYAPQCPGAADYRALAAGLLERWGREDAALAASDGAAEAALAAGEPAAVRSGGISLG
ncbi:MAG: ParA family protein [Phycisphaerales bacterium]